MLNKDRENGPQYAKIIDALGVGGWIIRHEGPEEDEDEVLESKCHPVDVSPRAVICDNA